MEENKTVIPEGYGVGEDRTEGGSKRVAHLYKLDDNSDFGKPMCEKGYTQGIYGYSIFRGHRGNGICKKCLDRALKGLDGVDFKLKNFDKLSMEDQKLIYSAMSGMAVSMSAEAHQCENDEKILKVEGIPEIIERNLKESDRLVYLMNVLGGHEKYED